MDLIFFTEEKSGLSGPIERLVISSHVFIIDGLTDRHRNVQ